MLRNASAMTAEREALRMGIEYFLHDQMTGCSCLTRLRGQTHRNKLTCTSSKLEHDSTRFSQKQTERGQTLKGNRQLSQATHCLVKKIQVPSVTSFKKDLPW